MSDEFEAAAMSSGAPSAPVPLPMPVSPISGTGCPNGQIYVVKSGDTMFLIAQRFGIPLQRLIEANPQVTNPNIIYPGQSLCVPSVMTGCMPGMTSYTVVRGDTLYQIAQRYGVSLDALIRANPQITNPNMIFPGQVICIPVPVGPPQCTNGFLYTVASGDTLYKIAQRYGITLDMLIRANPQITNPDVINVGQQVCIPFPMPPATCSGRYYTIQSGDTLTAIAKSSGVTVSAILAANPQIADANRIYAGQVICIPAVAVIPIPIPTPLPIPGPMPSPAPLPTPVPIPTPMPIPTPLPTPIPTPMPIPTPLPTPMPLPTPTPLPMPLPTPTPLPMPCQPMPCQPMPCQPPMMMPISFETCPYRPYCCKKGKKKHAKKGKEGCRHHHHKKHHRKACDYPMPY
ncbi:MAG TPA: SafA/ExsA family spore coat assembly protein [Bacillota bacterium]|nr:SafA/ExsA family spore coat assembly protein [Bacillota bacterium]